MFNANRKYKKDAMLTLKLRNLYSSNKVRGLQALNSRITYLSPRIFLMIISNAMHRPSAYNYQYFRLMLYVRL
jgi:hypothetical protein